MYSSGGLKPRCLAIDLETSREAPYRIRKLAAWRPDSREELSLQGEIDPSAAAAALDRLADGAAFVLGHNIVAHDLPVLRQVLGELALDRLPVVDTLRLSPIAFPQNPYHRLVKDYKLLSDSCSDPLRDCRLSLQLFQDEHDALLELGTTSPAELACHHFLLAGGAQGGLDSFFMKLRRSACPAVEEVRRDLALLLGPKVCSTCLAHLLAQEVTASSVRMPLAYALAWLRVAGGNSVLPPWVGLQFPETRRLIRELRDTPCDDPACGYCSEHHDPLRELRRHFGLASFRADPPAADGGSLQEAIVRAGMRGICSRSCRPERASRCAISSPPCPTSGAPVSSRWSFRRCSR
jgi:ATP-dependent DNA helicase RecQ